MDYYQFMDKEDERKKREKKDRGRAIYCKLYGEKEKPEENTLSYAQRMGYKNEREYQEAYKRSGIAEIARAKYKEYQAYCKSLDENISSPHEAEEKEADSIADKVMRKAKPDNSGNSPISQIKEKFNDLYDNPDLDNVKIHTNDKAAESAEALNARAFTQGKDIYFNKGEFKPGTEDGDRLIAHEMAHVVQGGNKIMRKKIIGIFNRENEFKEDYRIIIQERSVEEWRDFLKNEASTEKGSIELNVYMALATGNPLKALQNQIIKMSGIREVNNWYEGAKTSELKNPENLLIAMLSTPAMDLDDKGFEGTGYWDVGRPLNPKTTNQMLLHHYSKAYMPIALLKLIGGKYDFKNVTKYLQEARSIGTHKEDGKFVPPSIHLIKGASESAVALIREILNQPGGKESRAKIESIIDNIGKLGRIAGLGLKDLKKSDLAGADFAGDIASTVLFFIPCSTILKSFLNLISGYAIDAVGDSYETKSDIREAGNTIEILNSKQKEFVNLIDSERKTELIYWMLKSAFITFKEKMWETLAGNSFKEEER